MSQINVGLIEGRLGNRILKPPGGGYSEIFFTEPEISPKKAPPTRTGSVMESILKAENCVVDSPKRSSPHRGECMIASILKTEETSTTSVKRSINGQSTIEEKVEKLSIEEKSTNGTGGEANNVSRTVEQSASHEVKKIAEPQTPQSNRILESNGNADEPQTPEPKSPENNVKTPDSATRRARVPPGGFSSGLW